ncbi:predicted protein [Streptomyces viridochromogenes DSM 40736]|uniref:Predicted protein n=1 Tax=Streptomyces viridochromogenes (strain DSM 40736 / JCM 4977 / BCRC 1201 / Tue 494) TaxID=591159 RepID=D9X0G1_STRVT|nr:hypothetical protein [Streptomyces viridochromogenes]EFL35545.1 predicted protein [Streptomyces viridochromogenes DSM 40736]
MSQTDDAKNRLQQVLDKALVAQQPLAKKHVERQRRVHPDDTPQQLIRRLDRYYLAGVTTSGGASGAAGMVPGAGIPTALADAVVFTEASVLYTLSLAEVHGLHPEDVERRRLLVLTVLLGDKAVRLLDKAVGRTGPYWARRIVCAIPMSAINRANKLLGPRFITKYGTKQGVLVLSKQVPLGVGAALGAGGNHLFGRLTIRSARAIFGQPPSSWVGDGREDAEPVAPGSGGSAP